MRNALNSGVEVELQDDCTYCISALSTTDHTAIIDDDLSSVQVQTPPSLDNVIRDKSGRSIVKQGDRQGHLYSSANTIMKDLKTLSPKSCSPREKHSNHGQKQVKKWDVEKGVLKKDTKSKRKISATQKYTAGVKGKQRHNLEDKLNVKKRKYSQKCQTIEVKSKQAEASESNSGNFIGRIWSNRYAKIVIILVLCSILAIFIGGWLVKKVYSIPGLNQEIDDLGQQVDALQLEVDRLNGIVVGLDGQIDRLEATNNNLEETKVDLIEENKKAKEHVTQLQESNTEFSQLNEVLQVENNRYSEYTESLNATVTQLVKELSASTETKKALQISLDEYKEIRETLQKEVLALSNTAGNLNSTVQDLNGAIEDFQDENDRLSNIVSFIEVEANGAQKSYDELARALEETILRKRAFAEIGVKERMKSELAGWECGIVTAFGTHDFAKNVNYPIGFTFYDDVMDYTNGKLLTDFCIETTDMESYLKDEIMPEGASLYTINLRDFTRGVNIYTSAALNYYFPDEDDTNGLDSVPWEVANYECSKLPQDKKFLYTSSQ